MPITIIAGGAITTLKNDFDAFRLVISADIDVPNFVYTNIYSRVNINNNIDSVVHTFNHIVWLVFVSGNSLTTDHSVCFNSVLVVFTPREEQCCSVAFLGICSPIIR